MPKAYKQPTDTEFMFDSGGLCEMTIRVYLGTDASAERILDGFPEGVREAYREAKAADENEQASSIVDLADYWAQLVFGYDQSKGLR